MNLKGGQWGAARSRSPLQGDVLQAAYVLRPLNPPLTENAPAEDFELAINAIAEANGCSGQPRVVIFHKKEGRRQAHAVWSRIDPETMTARPTLLQNRLREISKRLYLEHG